MTQTFRPSKIVYWGNLKGKFTNLKKNTENHLVFMTREDFDAIVEETVLLRLESMKNSNAVSVGIVSVEKDDDKLLTRKEAAAMVHVHPATLLRWEKAEYLIPTRMGRRVLYRKGDVYDAMQKGGSVA